MYINPLYSAFLGFGAITSACSISDTKWTNFTSKIINVEPNNAAIKHQVGGSIKIINGCSFSVRNMTIIPTGNGVYWWGIPVNNNTDPYPRVVAAAMGSYNGQSAIFNLDPQYSFDDISIMEIYSEGDNRAYGAFSLSGNVSEHFNLAGNNAGLDNDPENPWGSSSSRRINSLSLLFPLVVIMSAFVLL